MENCSRGEVILVKYPFTDQSGSKIRPAVIVNAPHISNDIFIVPLTSRTAQLLPGEFALTGWKEAGLNVPTAVKRGLYTIHQSYIMRSVGNLMKIDIAALDASLGNWLGIR